MERRLFRYIWTHSRREQLLILALVLVSLPFFFASLDLPRFIVNDAIQGRAFPNGVTEVLLFVWKIHLPSFLGGGTWTIFPGVYLDRLSYLWVLSAVFLLLVLINGFFKYIINVRKGALGERLLQRMRHDMVSLLIRFTPESLRNVKPSEMATVVKDEVEPIGGFVGDAFIQPVFLGGQALTALLFILVQSPWLGAISAAIVIGQAMLIPRLRVEQLRLSRQRQIVSRALAGQVGDLVDGIGAIQAHGTIPYEMQRVDRRLEQLYHIRFSLYNRKFAVKFINNLLAQFTPFIFYALGGYLALTGALDIGQLVAVISAYRELPPPVKELIDWDQQRMDVQVKYEQVIEQFSPETLVEVGSPAPAVAPTEASPPIVIQSLRVVDQGNHSLLDGLTLRLPTPGSIGLFAERGEAADALARVLGRQIMRYGGTVTIGSHDLAGMPLQELTRLLAYVGPDAVIFAGTIRDNVAYGLNRNRPPDDATTIGDWTDYGAAGADGPADLDRRILDALAVVGLDEMVYRAGLAGTLDPARHPELASRIIDARAAIRLRLDEAGLTDSVEPFDPARYNRNATVGENLLFGVPIGRAAQSGSPVADPAIIAVLASVGLSEPLAAMGRSIAVIMADIFADLPPHHVLFEQFSFIASDQLPEFERIVARADRGEILSAEERTRLIELTLEYVEPRHRLSLLTPDLERLILAGRAALREQMPDSLRRGLEFYDPARYCTAAPLRDNLLFGRIAHGVAGVEERVVTLLRDTVERMGLEEDIRRMGLGYQTGHGGRLLTPAQRAAISLARAMVRRPPILLINDALGPFGEGERRSIVSSLGAISAGRSLIMVVRQRELLPLFDHVVVFSGSKGMVVDHLPDDVPKGGAALRPVANKSEAQHGA